MYADKDARDLSDLLASRKAGFGEVKVLRVLNRDATRENVLKAAEFLKPAGVDDAVVVFFAGHGVLDAKRDYYFGTRGPGLRGPGQTRAPVRGDRGLLDGVRARKKLLLVDTCHSGEVNKEDTALPKGEAPPDGAVRAVARGGLTPEAPPRVGLRNSFQLMQEKFADLRRGTGAVVVASAGGAEYALESAEWRNGVFTYAVLRGLKGGADRNRDGKVQVSELRGYVEEEVRRLTGGRQSPPHGATTSCSTSPSSDARTTPTCAEPRERPAMPGVRSGRNVILGAVLVASGLAAGLASSYLFPRRGPDRAEPPPSGSDGGWAPVAVAGPNAPPRPAPEPPGDPGKRALLVGVTKYDHLGPSCHLEGPSNDVRLMRSTLVRCYGFRPENVVCLTEDEGAPPTCGRPGPTSPASSSGSPRSRGPGTRSWC